jgi:hypothetical protein
MSSFVERAGGGLEIIYQGIHTFLCGGDQVDSFHVGHRLSHLLQSLHNFGQEVNLVFAVVMVCLLVTPSADSWCILVQEDTILMESLSTTSTRQSILPEVWLCRITSFRIPV